MSPNDAELLAIDAVQIMAMVQTMALLLRRMNDLQHDALMSTLAQFNFLSLRSVGFEEVRRSNAFLQIFKCQDRIGS